MSKKAEIVVARKFNSEGVSYETLDVSDYFCLGNTCGTGCAAQGEKALSHSFLLDTLRKVMGKTLTIIDSSIDDERKNKAMKDLVRNLISDEMEFSADMAFDQEKLQEMANEHFKDMSDEEIEASSVSIEGALGVK